jgi:hypothetical protein
MTRKNEIKINKNEKRYEGLPAGAGKETMMGSSPAMIAGEA